MMACLGGMTVGRTFSLGLLAIAAAVFPFCGGSRQVQHGADQAATAYTKAFGLGFVVVAK
jgi:hypothetical protein